MTTTRLVNDDDDYASRQIWTLAKNDSNIFNWTNDTFLEYNMELMMQSDAFAQIRVPKNIFLLKNDILIKIKKDILDRNRNFSLDINFDQKTKFW